MKKTLLLIGVLVMFFLTSFSSFVVAEYKTTNDQIVLDCEFGIPVIDDLDIADKTYDRIEIVDSPNVGNPGEPSLPCKGVYILVPQGEKVSRISVSNDEVVSLGSGFLVEPVGEAVPLSKSDSAPLPVPDDAIYSSNEMFPGKLFSEVGTYCCKGYEILVLRLHPVQYRPKTGELFYYPDLSVFVETVEDGDVSDLLRGLEIDELEIISKVANPSSVSSYDLNTQQQAVPSQSTPSTYDLLIITSEALKDGFLPLKQVHDSEGLSTIIYTVEDIINGYYPGVDTAEKIRNFIKVAYNSYKVKYVLLGGDDEIIPARRLWEYVNGGLIPNDFFQIPSDLYYSGLDGTWNNAENPHPLNKDLSLNDPCVSGTSSSQQINGPDVDYSNFIVGDSSMRVEVTENGNSWVTLHFDPPLDLTNKRWLNIQVNYSKDKLKGGFCQPILVDNRGKNYGLMDVTPESSNNGWENLNFEIYTPYPLWMFNYKKIEEIKLWFFYSSTINLAPNEGNYINFDGLHFTDFLDELWGEPDEDDLLAEVYVGRACVDNINDVQNFVNKTITYMDMEDENFQKKIVMAGEDLGWPEACRWGRDYLNQLIGKCRKFFYTTQGFPKDKFNIDKLYDYSWPGNDWPKSEIINRINNDVHIINHLGHANQIIDLKMEIPDVGALTNDKPCFIYSQGCVAGGFDYEDCIAEHFTVKTSNGAFAGIWNSRFGWGPTFSFNTDGISNRYHREFWDAVFSENITSIGKANQDSKEDNLWRLTPGPMRMAYYELNLFGDPSVEFNYLDSSLAKINIQSTPQNIPSSQPSQSELGILSEEQSSSPTAS